MTKNRLFISSSEAQGKALADMGKELTVSFAGGVGSTPVPFIQSSIDACVGHKRVVFDFTGADELSAAWADYLRLACSRGEIEIRGAAAPLRRSLEEQGVGPARWS